MNDPVKYDRFIDKYANLDARLIRWYPFFPCGTPDDWHAYYAEMCRDFARMYAEYILLQNKWSDCDDSEDEEGFPIECGKDEYGFVYDCEYEAKIRKYEALLRAFDRYSETHFGEISDDGWKFLYSRMVAACRGIDLCVNKYPD